MKVRLQPSGGAGGLMPLAIVSASARKEGPRTGNGWEGDQLAEEEAGSRTVLSPTFYSKSPFFGLHVLYE